MALLAEAIRASMEQTARYALADGTVVIVQRFTGREGPFDQEGYAVRVRPEGRPPEERFAAENLLETIERLRAWDMPGFDPEAPRWEPAGAADTWDPISPDVAHPTEPAAHQGAGEEPSPSVGQSVG